MQYVNIHTHRPVGRGIELRTAGIHPWVADRVPVASLLPLADEVQAIGETGARFRKAGTERPNTPHSGPNWNWPADTTYPSCSTACGHSER